MTILLDRSSRITGEINENFLRQNRQGNGEAEVLNLKDLLVSLTQKRHQVQAGQVAGRVIQEHVFRTRVAGVDSSGSLDRIPAVDGAVVLNAGITTKMRRFCHFPKQVIGLVGLESNTPCDRSGIPRSVRLGRAHERILHTNRVIRVLEIDRVVGAARYIEATVVARIDQRPGLFLFIRLAMDELSNVGVLRVEDHHLGRSARLAP